MFSPIRRWETVRKDDGDAETHFEVFPESFRMCFTVYFICFFLLATLITTQFGAIDLDDNPVVNRFGYLNLSVMFSDPPFTYFAFTLWFPAQIMLLSFEVFMVYCSFIATLQEIESETMHRKKPRKRG